MEQHAVRMHWMKFSPFFGGINLHQFELKIVSAIFRSVNNMNI